MNVRRHSRLIVAFCKVYAYSVWRARALQTAHHLQQRPQESDGPARTQWRSRQRTASCQRPALPLARTRKFAGSPPRRRSSQRRQCAAQQVRWQPIRKGCRHVYGCRERPGSLARPKDCLKRHSSARSARLKASNLSTAYLLACNRRQLLPHIE